MISEPEEGQWKKPHSRQLPWELLLFSLCLVMAMVPAACRASASQPPPPTPTLSPEITLYTWVHPIPQAVIDEFNRETGIRVKSLSYSSEEEALRNIRDGEAYDLVLLPPELLPGLISEGRLAEIDFGNVPNFKNVSANFRDLSYDPGNRHSIPFHWGSTGLLYRTDLVHKPVTSWEDLWDPEYTGKVALWPMRRLLISISLKSLGFPANLEDRVALSAALEHLIDLRKKSILLDGIERSILPVLSSGRAVIGFGWASDAVLAQKQNLPIAYVLPEEGSLLWSDHFAIPIYSPNKRTAELFLDFILRPEISAQVVNQSYTVVANRAARAFIQPELLDNSLVYPSEEQIRKAEIMLALSTDGARLYDQIWASFLNGR